MLCVLFFCVNLWEIECTLNEKRDAWDSLGSLFSHRAHRVHWAFWRTVSSPQNASGIQSSQSVTANEDTNKEAKAAYIQPIGVSRWSLPFPSGEGKGEGPLSLWNFACSVLLCSSVRKRTNPYEKKKAPSGWDKAHESCWETDFSMRKEYVRRTWRGAAPIACLLFKWSTRELLPPLRLFK